MKRGLFLCYVLDPIVGGAIVGGASQLVGGALSSIFGSRQQRKQQQWQEHMFNAQNMAQDHFMEKQQQMNRDDAEWSWQNFESPLAQRRAMEDAGINPFFQGGSAIQSGAGSGTAGTQQGSAPTPPSSGYPTAGNNIQAAFAGLSNIAADVALKKAQANKIAAETRGLELDNIMKDNENSLWDLTKAGREIDFETKQFNKALAKFESEVAPIRLAIQQGTATAQQIELLTRAKDNLSRAAKNDEEKRFVEGISNSIIKLNEAKADEAAANAGLAGARTQTENEMRKFKKALTRNEIAKAFEEAGAAKYVKLLKLDELAREMTGTYKATSIAGFVDKAIMGAASLASDDAIGLQPYREKIIQALLQYAE